MIAEPTAALRGTMRFIRYGFMPNRLTYCGPDANRTLLDYAMAEVSDSGLHALLEKFDGALPYLRLIARSNGIADPFDDRVVQAYWLGGPLLERVSVAALYDHLSERFRTQLNGRLKALVLGKAPAGAHPHHSFHVLDVYSRVSDLGPSLATIDNCRISWGQVLGIAGSELIVRREPVVLHEGKLKLGAAETQRVLRQLDGKGFADGAQIGDWVSMHWGWVCEVLTATEHASLEHATRYHLALANQTL
jgi:hypothetical protein